MAPQAAAAGAVGPEIGRQEAWGGGRYLTQSLEPQPASWAGGGGRGDGYPGQGRAWGENRAKICLLPCKIAFYCVGASTASIYTPPLVSSGALSRR